jgi:hypothetical protein
MEHTEALGLAIAPRNREKCGTALTDVDYDKSGRSVNAPTGTRISKAHCHPPAEAFVGGVRCFLRA